MGRALSSDIKTVIFKVTEYFKRRKADKESFEFKNDVNIAKTVAEATGYCEKTVRNVMKQGNASVENTARLKFNPPHKPKCIKKKHIVHDFDLGVIRRKIHHFYETEKKVPSVRKLLASLQQDGVLNCGREYLRNLLLNMGYQYKKCKSKRLVLIERPNITEWRTRYLNEIKHYRTQDRNIYFLGETYINASHNASNFWQSLSEPGTHNNISKGQRLIIFHIGGRDGLLEGALKIFKSDDKTGTYHVDVNGPTFYKWVDEQLKDKLLPNSVIVMDNAAYHNIQEDKKPTMTSLKSEMQTWLQGHNVEYQDTMKKTDLLRLINSTQREPIYKIDQLLKTHGHTVLRLPPYHTDLNPIELVWADIKNSIAHSYSAVDENYVHQLFSEFTAEKWQKCQEYVQENENDYLDCDMRFDDIIDNVIINLRNDAAITDTSSSDENEGDDVESMSE